MIEVLIRKRQLGLLSEASTTFDDAVELREQLVFCQLASRPPVSLAAVSETKRMAEFKLI